MITDKERIKLVNDNIASSSIRFLNFIIDMIAIIILTILLAIISRFLIPTVFVGLVDFIGYLQLFLSFFLYYVFMELKYQKTLGKFATKTRVIMKNGQKPFLSDIITRTFFRLIPFDCISFLFTRNGLHDSLSYTAVIKDSINTEFTTK